MDDTVDVVVGLFLGVLVGGAIGLLLAPRTGLESRAAIRDRFNLMIEEGRRAAAERRAELEAQFAEAKQIQRGA